MELMVLVKVHKALPLEEVVQVKPFHPSLEPRGSLAQEEEEDPEEIQGE